MFSKRRSRSLTPPFVRSPRSRRMTPIIRSPARVGRAAAAALLGNNAELYHLDTSDPSTPKARTIGEEIARVVRGRLTNPRWIKGMLGHGHRGVAEIAQGVDALFAFAATARAVPDHLFDATHDALIADERV